jgi:molybdopterin molybdotransferase
MIVKDMLGRSGVVSREEALTILNERLSIFNLTSQDISISTALGRVLARDITSIVDLPEFNRSTMDGYAVRSADTFGAAETRPALLRVVGDIPMERCPTAAL